MRRKNLNILLFTFIAFIVLGVGYAAINNINLIINGTGSVTATQENFNVKFLDIDGHRPTITPGSPNTVNVLGNSLASFDVSTLSKKGDTATATIDVKNESNGVGARIGLNLTNSNTTYFKVTEHIADTELQAGDITTVTVTIEMLKTPISADEVTSITATLTASPIENSTATGSSSSTLKVPTTWTLPAGRTATTLQVGDELQIKDQSFYFIRYDENNNAVLLAKYNLNVGNNHKGDAETYLQDSDVKSYWSGTNYGSVSFSASTYWDNNGLKSKYGSSYNTSNIYDLDYKTQPYFGTSCNSTNCYYTAGYSVAYYVEEYKSLLEGTGYGATIEAARLLLYSEAYSFTNNGAISELSFLRNTSFWLGTAYSSTHAWCILSTSPDMRGFNYNYDGDYGVRPVIVISPSNL